MGSEVIMTNHVSARDPDEDSSFKFALKGDGSHLFRIDQITGRVFFNGNTSHLLDREEKPIYHLRIAAGEGSKLHLFHSFSFHLEFFKDSSPHSFLTEKKSSNATLTIVVEDKNDNPPSFAQMVILPDQAIRVSKDDSTEPSATKLASSSIDQRSPLLYVPENVTVGSPIIRLVARDPDEGKNAEITYSILSEVSGQVASKSKPKSGAPVKRYFVMDSRSGEISVAGALPAETDIVLDMIARDGGGLADNVTVRVRVFDVNDHAPVFKQSRYSFDVPEGTFKRMEIGRIEAVDADYGDNANVTYELFSTSSEPNVKFEISRYRGGFFITGILDRETRDLYNFKVVAKDNGTVKMSSSVDVEIHVQDVNDNPPAFFGYQEINKMSNFLVDAPKKESKHQRVPIYFASVPENSQLGTIVTKVYANDSDFVGTGNGVILYDIPYARGQAQHFAIDSKDGLITTIGNLDYESQVTKLTYF